jgi:2-polyprenyl-3-methyl-5-hydroxy-6-metoxy-1,4-benzoquinol methylase
MNGTDQPSTLPRPTPIAGGTADEPSFLHRVESLRHRVTSYLQNERTIAIADLGCGMGEFLWLVRSMGYTSAIGIGQSEADLGEARKRGLTNVQREGVLEHLAAHPGAYDFILLPSVVEHFTKEELLRCLQLVREALKVGGRAVVLAPNAASPLGLMSAVSDITHEVLLTASSLAQVGAAAGLEKIFVGGTTPPPIKLRGQMRALVWTALRPVFAAVYGDHHFEYGRVMEPELIGVFYRAPT